MSFIEMVGKFLRLKALEAQAWAEVKIAALKAAIAVTLSLFLLPFLLAMIAHGFGASDDGISIMFGIFLVGTLLMTGIVTMRASALAAVLYGAGSLAKRMHLSDPKKDDHGKSLSGDVVRTLFKGFAWMIYVMAFYTIVPIWQNFVFYAVSLGIVAFVSYYVLGYAEDTSKHRHRLFMAAVIAFMAIVMASLGLVRIAFHSSEAVNGQLGSILLFDSAVGIGLIAIVCLILGAFPGDGKDAFKMAGKIFSGLAVVLGLLVFVFGDMTWLQFHGKYVDHNLAQKVDDAKQDSGFGGGADHTVTQPTPDPKSGQVPDSSASCADGSCDEAPPQTPAIPVGRPEAKPVQPATPVANAPEDVTIQPVRRVQKTPHKGDHLDKARDLLDQADKDLADVGL